MISNNLNTKGCLPTNFTAIDGLENKQTDICQTKNAGIWKYHKNTDDFGRIVTAFLCGKTDPTDSSLKSDHTFQNLKSIGIYEGFQVIPTKSFYFARDAKVRLINGTILRTTDAEDKFKETALIRSRAREDFLIQNHAMTATSHPTLSGQLGRGILQGKNHRKAADGFSEKSRNSFYDETFGTSLSTSEHFAHIKPSRSAWEGGNVITATNSNGEQKVLVGEELLTITQQILRQSKFFTISNPQDMTSAYIEETSSTFSELRDKINIMYKKKEIPIYVESLAPCQTDEEIIATGKEMDAMGLIIKFKPKVCNRLREITKEYLGQKNFVKEILWPTEFEVDPTAIATILQGAYHLDVIIKPGPNGSVFLQSYEKDIELLEKLQKNVELSNRDKQILQTCLRDSRLLAKDLKPVYDRIKEQLSAAGFVIIETPGAFHGTDGEKRFNCNFINAISGWSEKTKRFYYICLGTKIGDKFGDLLMDSYTNFMNEHVSPIKVYFIGYNPNNIKQYDEANYFNNKQVGVHCMTSELMTESFSSVLKSQQQTESTAK